MATTVAYSRVHNGVHFPGDVVAGGVIRAGVGTIVRHLADRSDLFARPGATVEACAVTGWRS